MYILKDAVWAMNNVSVRVENNEEVAYLCAKFTYVEKRMMNHIMFGFEAIRMLMEVFDKYMENGDPSYLLRQLRTICVTFMRSLSTAYRSMSQPEIVSLTKVMVFEAMRRHRFLITGDEAANEKFLHILELMCAQEQLEFMENEGPRLVTDPENVMTYENVSEGYTTQTSYMNLRAHGSYAAQLELYSFTTPHFETVRDRLGELQLAFLQQRAADDAMTGSAVVVDAAREAEEHVP